MDFEELICPQRTISDLEKLLGRNSTRSRTRRTKRQVLISRISDLGLKGDKILKSMSNNLVNEDLFSEYRDNLEQLLNTSKQLITYLNEGGNQDVKENPKED